MIMICWGQQFSGSQWSLEMVRKTGSHQHNYRDRVLGAGHLRIAIISGITTATLSGSAALGMAVGAGQFFAFVRLFAILIVPLFLKSFRRRLRFHHERTYKVTLEDPSFASEFENEVRRLKLDFRKERDIRNDGIIRLYTL
jgi:uncharacterized membrane protein YhiD involved in acid resistance